MCRVGASADGWRRLAAASRGDACLTARGRSFLPPRDGASGGLIIGRRARVIRGSSSPLGRDGLGGGTCACRAVGGHTGASYGSASASQPSKKSPLLWPDRRMDAVLLIGVHNGDE